MSISYFRLFITRSLSLHFSSSPNSFKYSWERSDSIDDWQLSLYRQVKPIYRTKLCILYELRLDTVCSVLVVESWWELHAPSARHFPNGRQYISRCRSAHYPGPDKWIMINGGPNLQTALSRPVKVMCDKFRCICTREPLHSLLPPLTYQRSIKDPFNKEGIV